MSIATSTAIGIAGAIGGIGAIGGAALSAGAAGKAAGTQAQAADQAAQLQYQESQNALDWQKEMFGIQEGLAQPWINTGTNALSELSSLFGMPSPSAGQAPTGAPPASPNPGGGVLSPGTVLPAPPGGFNPGGGSPFMPMTANTNAFNRLTASPFGTDTSTATPMRGPFSVNGSATNAPGGVLPSGQGATNRMPGQIFPTPAFPGGNEVSVNGTPGTLTVPNSQAATAAAAGTPSAATSGANPMLGVTNPNSYFQPFQNWSTQFQAPTNVTEQNDPGYQFRLQQGLQALQNSAAAKGTLLTGGTAKDINNYAQQDASNEYSNVYNRQLGEYQQNYNIFQNNQTGEFNRLMALAGMGQTGTSQLSSAAGQNANNVAGIDLTTGAQIGSNINAAGAARASGYAGTANAINSGIGGLTGSTNNLAMLLAYLNSQQSNANAGGGGV